MQHLRALPATGHAAARVRHGDGAPYGTLIGQRARASRPSRSPPRGGRGRARAAPDDPPWLVYVVITLMYAGEHAEADRPARRGRSPRPTARRRRATFGAYIVDARLAHLRRGDLLAAEADGRAAATGDRPAGAGLATACSARRLVGRGARGARPRSTRPTRLLERRVAPLHRRAELGRHVARRRGRPRCGSPRGARRGGRGLPRGGRADGSDQRAAARRTCPGAASWRRVLLGRRAGATRRSRWPARSSSWPGACGAPRVLGVGAARGRQRRGRRGGIGAAARGRRRARRAPTARSCWPRRWPTSAPRCAATDRRDRGPRAAAPRARAGLRGRRRARRRAGRDRAARDRRAPAHDRRHRRRGADGQRAPGRRARGAAG